LRTGDRRLNLSQQPLQVLLALLEQPGQVVMREELQRRLWADDTFVGFDDGLNTIVKRLRDALGDSAERSAFIETLPRRGYRFIGKVEPPVAAPVVAIADSDPRAPPRRRRAAAWIGAAAAVIIVAVASSWMTSSKQATGGAAARDKPAVAASPGVHADAYLAWIQGRYYWNQRTAPSLEKALASFRHALDIDPTYAAAYAGMADCYTALGYGSYLAPSVAFERAKAAARQALTLDTSLADPHASLGYAKLYYDWDFAGAEREFRQALALDPDSVTAHEWYGVYLTAMGRFADARMQIDRAQHLDPLSVAINTDVGFVEYYSGRHADAVTALRGTVEMNPSFPLAHLWLGRAYEEQRRYDDAIAEYRSAATVLVDWPVTMAALGHAYAVSGRRSEARQTLVDLKALSSRKYVTPYGVALVHAGLGDADQAFAWLDRAVADRANWLVWLKLDPRFDNLHRDPRFNTLLRRVGLVQ
jgi:DNA-binding winged helix-turn-helix (wHTH) protein/tetratricopeptide (TPR) repeat protein